MSEIVTSKRTIGVLFGGRSLEHDVSVVSGLQVLQALDSDRYRPLPIYIDHSGHWWTGETLWHRSSFSKGGPNKDRLTEVVLSSNFGASELRSNRAGALPGLPNLRVDVFLPILHGTYGEDGCIQGLLELTGCAYVGCGVAASAIGMNKRLSKLIVSRVGIPVVPWRSIQRSVLDLGAAWLDDTPVEVESVFGWPVIVKPCNLGSSAGVSVAHSPSELNSAILRVFEYDTEGLIEPFIKNRLELNVAVVGLDTPVASITEMPVTLKGSHLSFSEKYKRQGRKSVSSSEGMASAVRVLDPLDLPAEMRATAQEFAIRAFTELGCEGISRVDFLIDTDRDELFFNEINTLPGSLAYYLWSAPPHYWTITELLTKLIERAERIRATRVRLERQPPPELRLLG